jgi:predicted RNase H-like HicB family nuclease
MDFNRHSVIVCWSEENQAFLGACPRLEGCMAHGETPAEALENVSLAIAAWLEAAEEHGWEIPEPDTAEKMAEMSQQAGETFVSAVQEAVSQIVPQVVKELRLLEESQEAHFGLGRAFSHAAPTKIRGGLVPAR